MRKGGKFLIRYLVLPLLVVLIVGCGASEKSIDVGQDYSSSELVITTSPRLQNGITDNVLSFSWIEKPGVDFYRLSLNEDGLSGYEAPFAKIIPSEAPDTSLTLPDCADVPDGDPAVPGVDCLIVLPDCADVPDGDPAVPYADCLPTLVIYNYELPELHLFKWKDALFLLEACEGSVDDPDPVCFIVGVQSVRSLTAKVIDAFTAPYPNGQGVSTFGISVALSEDGLLMAVGGNGTSVFECEQVSYTHILEMNEDETEYLPCQVFRALPYCQYVENGVVDVSCVIRPPYCVDIDITDPDAPACLNALPYCVDRDDTPLPGENCLDELPYCVDRPDTPLPGENCLELPYCVEIIEGDPAVPGTDCMSRLPYCVDRPDGVPGETCQVYIDCEALAEDEEVPLQCIVYQTIPNAGAVYLYSRDTKIDPWELDQFLKAPVVEENDYFGWAVSMSDDGAIIAVSALGEDGDTSGDPENNDLASAGAAYMYTRDADEWVFADYLKADNAEASNLFGWALDISGDGSVVAVSAAREATANLDDEFLCEGAVYIYALDGPDQWSQQASLKAANPQQNDVFGESLSLDYTGSLLAVGATQDPDDGLLDAQIVNGSVWLTGCDPAANPAKNTGFVSLYERTGSSWSALPDELRPSNANNLDHFGASVSLNDAATRLAVGAAREDSLSTGLNGFVGNHSLADSSGAVYLFDKDAISSEWLQSQYLKASNTGPNDKFGTAVSLSSSGATLAVGAEGEANYLPGINRPEEFDKAPNTGAIYVFKEDSETLLWSQVAYVKPPSILPGGMGFGWDLELANDGDMLVGSAPAFRAFGTIPGSVFVY
ncbi:MAG: hypothetical protein GY746_18160 [Gammaproteobacteria bacterium]|nr:hypothetical protein [Gammaproteobacteria bacterium]MCP4831822.1 hypothetical protein [Gammaproteobacteria bacterium]